MYKILLVGSGGFIGSVLRYLVSSGVHRLFKEPILPYGTLAVNVSGCLLIGFLGGVAENKQLLSADVRLFLFLGMLGGFTTFSSFGYDTFQLFRGMHTLAALANIFLQMALGLTAVYLGHLGARLL